MVNVEKNPFYVSEDKLWFKESSGWPKEVPKNIEFPKITLGEFLDNTYKAYPDNKAIWFLDTFMSYKELKSYVDALATALHQLGVKKGDTVGILLPNSFQYVIAYYAATSLGAIATGINPTYKSAEVLHQLTTTNVTTLIFMDAFFKETIEPILSKTSVKNLIATNIVDLVNISELKKIIGKFLKKIPSGPYSNKAYKFTDLLKTKPNLPKVDINPLEDTATYIMTGGTTGLPKAAILTHFNVISNAIQSKTWIFKCGPGTCAIGILPLFHSFAMTCVMNISIAIGGFMMLFPRPPAMEEFINKMIALDFPNGTMLPGAEILFKKIADYVETLPDFKQEKLKGKFGLCVSGAGPLHRPVQELFERVTKSRLVEGYGLTEASPVVSAGPFWGNRKIGTIGLPFPGTDWKIIEPNTLKELPVGEENVGELCVAGPQVMKGYLNQPEETAETLKKIGDKIFLLTGDIGYMDEDGQVVIRDRKKQLIKYKGLSIFPKEVEELIGKHPFVSEVAVAGLPDKEFGEVVKAWVVLKPDKKGKLTEEELIRWCKENMTYYKVPKYIEFRDELPKSLVGKVMRRTLQENDPIYKQTK